LNIGSRVWIDRGSICKVHVSQHRDVPVWDRDEKRYIFKGTDRETSVIAAREVAQDHA
jgi:hypothetical protein